ncbi:MAG: hypothetical protein LQ350_005653 [Teloschistes chrysophthalmus]|nr:MAG: hypothetical protein LQ350_005653 [Niorma chrysophthalma]
MTPVLVSSLGWQYLLILLLVINLTSARSVCDRSTLGAPFLRDCLTLFDRLPFAMTEPKGDLTAPRLFVEPQFLTRPFTPVKKTGTIANMIQLPKIWQLRSCRIALMSFPDDKGIIQRPINNASWRTVQFGLLGGINQCVRARQMGSVEFIVNSYGKVLMMGYVYERGSRFEQQLLNEYMTNGTPLNPRSFIPWTEDVVGNLASIE